MGDQWRNLKLFDGDDVIYGGLFKPYLIVKITCKSNQLIYKHKVVNESWELSDISINVLE